MKTIYALLTLLGIALPFSQFTLWLVEYGFDVALFLQQIIENPLAAFAWLDVVVTVIVIVFMVFNVYLMAICCPIFVKHCKH